MIRFNLSLLCLLCFISTLPAQENLTLAQVFGDQMVLQREKEILVWGKASKYAEIIVRLANQQVKTQANKAGPIAP